MRFRRLIQFISLGIFLFLLGTAVISESPAAADFFLRLDPVLITVTAAAGRIFPIEFLPAVIVILFAVAGGRIFCGFICPMGTTLDGGDKLFGSPLKTRPPEGFRKGKYAILAFLLGSAIFGVSFVFSASPLSLITRFYGLVLYPMFSFIAARGLEIIQPAADYFDLRALIYLQIKSPRFATQFFILIFFIILFACIRFSPRFWCRYLCPAGAFLALFSRKPLIRRRVSDDCTKCGKCVRRCPMNAISEENPEITRHEECIVCGTCENVCPVNAVSFAGKSRKQVSEPAPAISLSRRQFIYYGSAGAGTAILTLTGLTSPYGKPGEGQVAPPGLVRAPGSLPETDFLSRCVRCGECMAACPTNTLQPIWLSAGLIGIFSPALTPRRGYCDPGCTRCGDVCPTGAIRSLSKHERIWAKTGTAMIFRQKCLAWEYQKSCMVCDEVCPFDAIEFKREPGNPFAVPHVIEDNCAGCGYCEHFCPIQNQAAITVTPMGALRLADASYEAEGKRQGLNLRLKPKDAPYGFLPNESVPGFDEAPGFDNTPGFDNAPGFDDRGVQN